MQILNKSFILIIIPAFIFLNIWIIPNYHVEALLTLIIFILGVYSLIIMVHNKLIPLKNSVLLLLINIVIASAPITIFPKQNHLYFAIVEIVYIPLLTFLLYFVYHLNFSHQYRIGVYSIHAAISIILNIGFISLFILHITAIHEKDISFLRLFILVQLGIIFTFDLLIFLIQSIKHSQSRPK
jgi:hypothetical protein